MSKWSLARAKSPFSTRQISKLAAATLIGALIAPIGSFTFPFFTTSAHAATTLSSGTDASYVDVPFTCSPTFYQTAAPATAYPSASDGTNPRLFTYNPISNRYSGSTKTIPVGNSSGPNAIGYNTVDNYIYGVYNSTGAAAGFGTANIKYIVRIDSTGNYKLVSKFTTTNSGVSGAVADWNPISGDFWKKGAQNRYVIHSGVNLAYLDVTTTADQQSVPLAITGITPSTLDTVIVGDTLYGVKGLTLYIVNLNTLVGTSKAMTQAASPGSTAISASDNFGSAFSDSGGNLYFFNNTTSQVWMIEAAQLSQTFPQIKPLGSGTALMEGSTSGVTLPNDGASCPLAGSPYSSQISAESASNISATGVTLSATVNPIGISTTATYCYGTTSATSGGALQACQSTASPTNASTGTPLTGTTGVPLNSLGVTSLNPGTTYYWQVVTSSSWATTYGAVNTFTTLSPPSVSTTAATSITTSAATLNGFINPRSNSTTTSFCYGTSSNLAGCTSVSAVPSSLNGSANSAVSLSLSGLTSGTQYYFRADGTYSGQTVSGSTLTFTTPALPVVTRSTETNKTSLAVQLNGSVNPQGAATTVSFCLGTDSNLAGCRTYNANESPLIASNTSFSVSANIGSLTASTTYYYNIRATNSNGSSSTSIYSFTTAAPPLEVTTQNGGLPQGTVGITYSNTLVAAGGSQPYTWSVNTGTTLPGGLALNATSGIISGTPSTAGNYTFTIKVTDSATVSTLKEFTMTIVGSPSVTTSSADTVTATTATLKGLVNPRNLLTAVSFCYGTDPTFAGCTQVIPSQSPLAAGTSDIAISANISNLNPGTNYYARIAASNGAGSISGNSISFTTPSPPSIATGAATNFNQAGTSGTLNAVVNPKSSQTAVTFCYGTSPTLSGCTSVTASQSPLASSTESRTVSASISGLSANTVYYFDAIATNSAGTTYGSTGTFTTPTGSVNPPTITGLSTSSIGDISGASVTITGTGFSITGAQAQVTIGGVNAPVTSRTSTTGITVTAPAGVAGATTVVVTNIDGQSASSSALSFVSSAPTSVSGSIDNGQSSLTWTATSFTPAVSNYLVQYSSNDGASWTSVTRNASTTASMMVTGLINGTSYKFRVAAINSVGTGTFSVDSAAVIPQTTPGQPTNLTGSAGSGQATLNWDAPTDNGGRNITTYKTEYSSNGGNSWTDYPHPSSSSTSLVVTGLNNGTSYIFRVAAINSVGTGTYSSNSSTVNLVAPLNLAFGSRPVVVFGEPAGTYSVTAYTSPLNIGTIVFGSSSPSVCTVNPSSGSLTILTTGTCTITANNSGSVNYSAATQQTQNIPVSSASLAGLNLTDLDFLTSASVIGSTSYTLNASSSDTQLTLTIPSNALPVGTLVKIYLNRNLTTAGQLITSTSYLLNFVVSWMNTNDGSIPTATSPLVISAVNASIKKGMIGYGILNGVPTQLGVATSNGSINLNMSEDPLLVVAPTKPGSPTSVQASSGLNQSSLVSWTVPSNDGGEAITGYRVTASPGGSTCTAAGPTATSCTVGSLQNGTSYTFTVQAINGVGSSDPSSQSNSVIPAGAPTFTAPSSGLSGIYNSSYSLQLTATGASTGSGNVAISSYALTSGTLPAGLNLNSSTGLISGTPSATGSSALAVRATDANSQTASASFTIQISRSTQSIGFTISPTSATSSGSGYSAVITPTLTNPGSGSGSLTYAISAGGTASGCAITSASNIGTLSATSSGTCQITATKVQDTNYQQATATQSFTFYFASASTLVITSTSGVFGTDLNLTSSGGSAGGSTSYSTTTTGCSITGSVLQTTLATTCVVTAVRTADAFGAQTTSVETNIVIDAPTPTPTVASTSSSSSAPSASVVTQTPIPAPTTVDNSAELQAAQVAAAAELQVARDKAEADAKAASDAAALAKATNDAKAAAETKAQADAELAAQLAANKITPDVTLYSISPKLTLSAFDLAYLKKYLSTLKKTATVTCIGYTYTQKLSLAKATVLAKNQANAVCVIIKKLRPTLKTSTLIRPAKSAPKAAVGAQWVAISYRVDGYQIKK